MEQKTKTIILFCLAGIVLFLLGMKLESIILISQFNEVFADYEQRFINNSVQKFEFNLSAHSAKKTQETLNGAFACVLGDGNVMVDMYANVFIPALYGQPVCFVNNLTFNNSQKENIALSSSGNDFWIDDFSVTNLSEEEKNVSLQQ